MKKLTTLMMLAMALLAFSVEQAWADGYTNWAVPTGVWTTGGNSILVEGPFGNREGCATTNAVSVPEDTDNLKLTTTMALSALLTSRSMRFYVIGCESYNGTTFNRAYSRNAELR